MIRRKDLVDIGDGDYHHRQGEFMECQQCATEFGGTRGDYWMMAMDVVFHCKTCGSDNIALVKASRTITIIKQ